MYGKNKNRTNQHSSSKGSRKMAKWKKDDIAVFTGYTDTTMAEADKLLQPGTRLRIHSIDKSGAMAAVPIIDGVEDVNAGDTVFEEEILNEADWNASQGIGSEFAAEVNAEVASEEVTELKPAAALSPSPRKGADPEVVADAEAAMVVDKKQKITPVPKKTKEKVASAQASLPVIIDEESDELEVRHQSSVQQLLAEKDALEAAKELVNRADETEFALGGVLAHIQREGIHQRLGYDGKRGFEDYIHTELGVKYRKARYLITNYEYFTALGIDETRLSAMGWSKAKELVGHATRENFDALVDYANTHTRDDLVDHIKTSYVDASDGTQVAPKAKLTKWQFSLFDDQNNTVARAIEAAKKQAGSDDNNAALEFICGEWSLMSEGQETNLEEQLELLQARFGVRLQVVHETEDGQLDIEDVA
jgi:hypothetical protein